MTALSELAERLDNTFERTGSGYREIVEAADALREAEAVLLECHTLLGTMPLDTARLNRLWPRLSAMLERTTQEPQGG